jgi:hypothetical protein
MQKITLKTSFPTHIKIISKWIRDLDVEPQSIKSSENFHEVNFLGLGLGKTYLHAILKYSDKRQ